MIVVYYLFVVLAWFIAVLPFRVVYIISDFFCFVLYRIIGYRKKVVYNNIQRSFPEKTDEEVKQIMNKFYHHLCDV
ncbi:MAG: lipid A biosynthesis acyltransferase, partial [Bacteroidota bacterium]|nr:lipid A biosynthesis acyltransferase [Bacteroidota bacterium]